MMLLVPLRVSMCDTRTDGEAQLFGHTERQDFRESSRGFVTGDR